MHRYLQRQVLKISPLFADKNKFPLTLDRVNYKHLEINSNVAINN